MKNLFDALTRWEPKNLKISNINIEIKYDITISILFNWNVFFQFVIIDESSDYILNKILINSEPTIENEIHRRESKFRESNI